MKKFLYILGLITLSLLGGWFVLNNSHIKIEKQGSNILAGLSVLTVQQGGTGASTLTGCVTAHGTGPFTASGSCGGGSSFTGAANSVVATDETGALIATGTQVTVGNLIATTTATSYFLGKVGIGTTTPWAQFSVNPNALGSGIPEFVVGSSSATHLVVDGGGNVGLGGATPSVSFPFQFIRNVAGVMTMYFQNTNSSTNADVELLLGTRGTLFDQTTGASVYADRTDADGNFGSTDLLFKNSKGNGFSTNLIIKSDGQIGIGTTTPNLTARTTIASSTNPQLALSAGAGVSQWTFRNAGGSLFISTTTVTGTATSSDSALSINPNGQVRNPFLVSCDTIDTDASGNLSCGTDSGGAGSGAANPFTNSSITVPSLGTQYTSATTSALKITSLATTTILNLNGVYVVPPDFATNGCAGNATYTDFGQCTRGLYSLASTSGNYAAKILVPPIYVSSTQWTTAQNYNINGLGIEFECTRGATLIWGGTGTSTIINTGNPTGHYVSEISGCNFQGNTTLIAAGNANTKTTGGIVFGGSNGGVGVNFHDNNVNGFGMNIAWGGTDNGNAYMLNIHHNSISGGNGAIFGNEIFMGVANNSGERNIVDSNSITDPGGSVEDNCIYIKNGSAASTDITKNSIDDCQIFVGSSNGTVNINENHLENAAFGTYGAYIPVLGISSDLSTLINFNGNEIANDTSGANSFDTILKVGGPVNATGNHIDNYGGGTVSAFVDHSLDNGISHDHVCQLTVQGGALTNIVAGSGGVAYSRATAGGCVDNTDNSYTIGLRPLASNTNEFFSGSSVPGSFDHNGNWTLGIAAVPSTVTIQKTLTVAGAATVATTLGVTGATTMSAAATVGTTLGVATTTPVYPLTSFSSSQSQLALSAGANIAQWAMRNAGGNFYLGTTTVAGTATSSVAALTINGTNGAVSFSTTTSGCATFSTLGEVYSTGTACGSGGGSGTVSSGLKGQLGYYNVSGTTLVGTSTNPLYVDSIIATSTTLSSEILYRLGIGTAAPGFKLHIKETDSSTYAISRIENDAGKVLDFGLGPSTAGAPYGNNAYFSTGSTANEQLHFFADGTGGIIDFYTGGSGATNQRMFINLSGVGIGTTTPSPVANLTVASTTGSQLSLSAGANINQWTMRNAGGNFYLSSTTVQGLATTSTAALTIIGSNGAVLLSTTTSGCATYSTLGELYSTGSACGLGAIGDPFTHSTVFLPTSATTSKIAIGTTTPYYSLTVASTTGAQIALSDGTSGIAQWVMRNAGGTLYISTTTVAGTATTSTAALTLSNSGSGLFVGTTTNSAATGLAMVGTGYWSGLSGSAGLQVGILCLSATNEIINESVACVASDERAKDIYGEFDGALNEINQITPILYKYKSQFNGKYQNDSNFNGLQLGLGAKALQDLDPKLVTVYTQSGNNGVFEYKKGEAAGPKEYALVTLALAGVKELDQKVSDIEKGSFKSVQDKWQWIVMACMFGYIVYNEYEKRHK